MRALFAYREYIDWIIKKLSSVINITFSSHQMAQNQLKEGVVMTYQVLQNTTTYQLRLALTAKGLWACI